ncbi:MAG: hypothetical protein WD711_09390 [Dongiaceae bacterium]
MIDRPGQSAFSIRPMIGASVLSFVLGSVHAFSVLILPAEAAIGSSRAAISLIYSLATASLIVGVLVTPWLLDRARIARMALLSGTMAAAGLALSAAGSYPALLIGFGVIFGVSNGVGYALSIRIAGLVPDRAGIAIGIVTAIYCGGAMAFSHFLSHFATPETYAAGLLWLALLMAIAGVIAASLLYSVRPPNEEPSRDMRGFQSGELRLVVRVWVVYFLGLVGGLIALGHAAAIVAATGASQAAIAAGAVIVSAGSLFGSLVGGYLSDRVHPYRVLQSSLGCVMAAMILLWHSSGQTLTLVGLGVAGLAYGGLITVVPVLTRATFAASVAFRAFAYVFLAWGVAGFLGPWIAGFLFDATARYGPSFLLGLALAGVAMLLARGLSRSSR